jgi:hypothetical protein
VMADGLKLEWLRFGGANGQLAINLPGVGRHDLRSEVSGHFNGHGSLTHGCGTNDYNQPL